MNDTATALRQKLIRNFNQVATEREVREPLYDTACARLGRGTVAGKLGVSVDTVAPGKRACPYHFHHAQEELFVVIEGRGSLRVAGELLPLARGDLVFIPPGPEYPHQIINTSDAPLTYLSISTRDSPEIVEYPDSGKYCATVANADGRLFDAIGRCDESCDYWDGEP